MLFEEFIEQHRVERLLAHTVRLPLGVATQVRVPLGHFLGDQTELRCPGLAALEEQHGLAGLIHRFMPLDEHTGVTALMLNGASRKLLREHCRWCY